MRLVEGDDATSRSGLRSGISPEGSRSSLMPGHVPDVGRDDGAPHDLHALEGVGDALASGASPRGHISAIPATVPTRITATTAPSTRCAARDSWSRLSRVVPPLSASDMAVRMCGCMVTGVQAPAAAFSRLPGVALTPKPAGMSSASPVRGLRPVRAARSTRSIDSDAGQLDLLAATDRLEQHLLERGDEPLDLVGARTGAQRDGGDDFLAIHGGS